MMGIAGHGRNRRRSTGWGALEQVRRGLETGGGPEGNSSTRSRRRRRGVIRPRSAQHPEG